MAVIRPCLSVNEENLNMAHHMHEQLRFSSPATARIKEDVQSHDLLFPYYGDGTITFNHQKFTDSPSMYRNVITWYFKAAGLTTATIASHLSISPSRVNALALRTRKQLYSGLSIELMHWAAKEKSLSPGEIPVHVFAAIKSEMRAAEHALSHCYKGDCRVVSGALRLGRAAYVAAMEPVIGLKCSCDLCKLQSAEFAPYWGNETESN